MFMIGLFLKNRLPPISTPPDTLFPYTPRFRSAAAPDRLRPAARAASRIPRAGSVSAPDRARSRPDLLRCAGRGIASGTGVRRRHNGWNDRRKFWRGRGDGRGLGLLIGCRGLAAGLFAGFL